ncbi:MAG: hypothetical protein Q9213_001779 [Squamulea squamosa]
MTEERLQRLVNSDSKSERRHCSLDSQDTQKDAREIQAYAEEKYTALIRLGGRPTRPIQRDAGHWAFVEGVDDCLSEEDDEQKESRWVIDHWAREGSKFAQELHAWQAFRIFQRHVRRKRASLWDVQERVDDYWKGKRTQRDAKAPAAECSGTAIEGGGVLLVSTPTTSELQKKK